MYSWFILTLVLGVTLATWPPPVLFKSYGWMGSDPNCSTQYPMTFDLDVEFCTYWPYVPAGAKWSYYMTVHNTTCMHLVVYNDTKQCSPDNIFRDILFPCDSCTMLNLTTTTHSDISHYIAATNCGVNWPATGGAMHYIFGDLI